MKTPQEIEQISFGKATFGGYNMDDVDAFLEPMIEDYITLYKENGLLKSKMKVLVSKLEEYRNSEDNMKDAIVNAQKTCDMMVKDAEAKCTQMLSEANAAAIENAKNADALIAEENSRVEAARKEAAARISALQEQLSSCIAALEKIKEEDRSLAAMPSSPEEVPAELPDLTSAVADEIAANIAASVGSVEEAAPKAEPMHPINSTSTSKFSNLKFGQNYDPTGK